VSRDGGELYIANETLGLDIWDLTSGTRITSLPMEGNGLALSPDGTVIYVTGSIAGTINIVDRQTRAIKTTITTGGAPRNMAFNKYGQEALITKESGYVTIIR
jgi:large repetitive protein